MDKKTAGLISAIAGLATMGSVQAMAQPAATPQEVLQPSSYSDLLAPIANPVELLHADDAARLQQVQRPGDRSQGDHADGSVRQVQYYEHHHHHHHHHHHSAFFAAVAPAGALGSTKTVA